MSVRWAILAVMAVIAVIAVIAWRAAESRRKTMSAAERDLADYLLAQQRAVDKEVSRRPRVRAGTLPTVTPTTKGTK